MGSIMFKKVLIGLVAVLVAVLVAFLWGALGKSAVEDALERSTVRGGLLAAGNTVLAARIAIYNTNFGDASRHLEEARAGIELAVQRLQVLGLDDEAKQLEAAIVPVRDAQQLAGKLDLGANSRAEAATKIIDAVLRTLPAS